MADDKKLLQLLIAELRVWEAEQDDDVVLPDVVDQVEYYLHGDMNPPPPIPTKPKTNPGRRITSLKTLRDWWAEPNGERKLAQWLESKTIHDLKLFCKQEKITITGQKTRNVLVYTITNAVSGPRIAGFEVRRRRRVG